MLKEIQEQPQYLKNLIDSNKDIIHEKINSYQDKFDIKRIILTGCGDSLCAALTNEYAFSEIGFSTFVFPPMELSRYRFKLSTLLNEKSLLIPISVSGRTPRVIESINTAVSKGSPTLAITNNPESPVAQTSNDFIYAKSSEIDSLKTSSYDGDISSKYVGYEHDVPQTKSYTSIQMTLQMIATSLGKDPEFSFLEEIPNIVKKVIQNNLIKELGVEHSEASRYIYSASGPNYGNALFAEFKMYEFSLLGFSKEIEEYCHTSYFITEENTPVMFIAPEGKSLQRVSEISPILEKKIGAFPMVLSNIEPHFSCKAWIEIPYTGEERYSIIPYGVVAPLYAYWVAKTRGLNVNTFRGGVEQEKYVEGSYYTIRKSKIKNDFQ